MKFKVIDFFSLGFGSGLSPFMPGTCGTLAAIPLYLLLNLLPNSYYIIILVVMILVGFWICDITEKRTGIHDNPAIVWDEIVGFLLTMAFTPTRWYLIVAGFILFRIFDIWKPYPISWLNDHIHGGFGIVVDDLLAAVYAGVALQIILYFCG